LYFADGELQVATLGKDRQHGMISARAVLFSRLEAPAGIRAAIHDGRAERREIDVT
jgi:hypothetical protein